MKEIQKVLDELPFPAVGFTPEGQILQNELAVNAKVATWLRGSPPEIVKQFLNDEVAKSLESIARWMGSP